MLNELSSPSKVSTDDLDYSNASYMKWTWYVEFIEMNACDIMND